MSGTDRAVAVAPWTDPAVAEGLHAGWTTDPRNVADADRLVGAALAEVPLPDGVLDYGCGTGRLARYFPSSDARPGRAPYLGYDASPTMLAVARREFPAHEFVDHLAHGRRFDLVLCNSVLQYQPDCLWADVARDVAGRARRAALIETYDGLAARPVAAGGGGAAIYCRTTDEYLAVLGEFGTVERRLLAAGQPPETHDLVLYVVRP